jgi:hypothetical protein
MSKIRSTFFNVQGTKHFMLAVHAFLSSRREPLMPRIRYSYIYVQGGKITLMLF